MQTSDWIASASLGVSFTALAIAWYAAFKANRNSSVATLVTLNEAFRQAWDRFLNAPDEKRRYRELCELMNLLEISCGIQVEGSLSGMSKKMVTIYLDEVLGLLLENDYTRDHVPKMIHASTTFDSVKAFLKSKPKYLEWLDLEATSAGTGSYH